MSSAGFSVDLAAEFGDCPEAGTSEAGLGGFRLLPVESAHLAQRVREEHRRRKGLAPVDAEFHFLDHAKCLDFYGFDLYEAKVSGFAIRVQFAFLWC